MSQLYKTFDSTTQAEHTPSAKRESGETLFQCNSTLEMNFPNSSSCCQENNTMIEGCEAQREEGCTEIFGGITALQALPGLAGISTWVNTRCPGCPFSCPRAMPCRVPIKGQKGVRCCKPIGLGRSSNVLACPFRCIT